MGNQHTIEIRESVNDDGSKTTSIAIFESKYCRYIPKYKFELLQNSTGLSLYFLPAEDQMNLELMTDDEQFQTVIELINAIENMSETTEAVGEQVRILEKFGFKGTLKIFNADLTVLPRYNQLDKRFIVQEDPLMRDLMEFFRQTHPTS